MGHPTCVRVLVLLTTMAIGAPTGARASDPNDPFPHIRADDRQMGLLIHDAMQRSETVRTLVERLSASDVVVYVVCDRDPKVRGLGRLNFMSAAGGVRYVLVRLKPTRRETAIAAFAHELQHAAEIADRPAIVDEASLGREYERIGYRNHLSFHGVAFDTKAAVETGRRVEDELREALRAGS